MRTICAVSIFEDSLGIKEFFDCAICGEDMFHMSSVNLFNHLQYNHGLRGDLNLRCKRGDGCPYWHIEVKQRVIR